MCSVRRKYNPGHGTNVVSGENIILATGTEFRGDVGGRTETYRNICPLYYLRVRSMP